MNATERIELFWSYVVKLGFDDCWLWLGGTAAGYGKFFDGEKMRGVHCFAFLLAGGRLTPERPNVLHSCDNTICVNPKHLRSGSQKDNVADMVRAGRSFLWGRKRVA